MKKLLSLALLLIAVVSCKYDDDELWDKVNELDDRVSSIESTLSKMNSDIASLSAIVNALENNVYVSSVVQIENGYKITFTDGTTAVIHNGKDGADGKDGEDGKDGADGKDAPVIGIDEYEGSYYWVQIINGEKSWLTDKDGNKIPVTGKDAVTPILKVNADGYWVISYDHGITFELLLDENGNPVKAVGTDGTDGTDGDSFFSDIKVVDGKLVLVLKDGTVIEVPIVASVGDLTKILTTTEGISDWNKAFITSKGYFLYRENVVDSENANSGSNGGIQECLSYSSVDGEKSVNIFISKNDKLPLQIVCGELILNFSYINDSTFELVVDRGESVELIGSINYSLSDLETQIRTNGYDDELKRTLFYFISLIESRISDLPEFADYIDIFKFILKIEYEVESETKISELCLHKEDGVYGFVIIIDIEYVIVINKIYYYISMWTGSAAYDVSGYSCLLKGTIWCASGTYNDYGTYGIVCDTDPEKLTINDAEFVGTGFQGRYNLNYGVEFKNLKPETKYYYRAYYKFNSNNHGKLKFKHGDANAQVGYDYVVKSFVTEATDDRIDDVVPEDIRDKMGDFIAIYDGVNPPNIEGVYFIDPFVAVYCEDYGNGGFAPGAKVQSHYIKFYNQNTSNNTIDYRETSVSGSSTSGGDGVFISGSGNNFTIFFNTIGQTNGISTKTALVISGTKTDNGVKDLYYAFVMVEKGADPNNKLMKEGVFRVFKDSDGLSVPSIWPSSRSINTLGGINYALMMNCNYLNNK